MHIDRVLELFGDGGGFHSTGAFTIDPDRAREKLKRFQLADPHHYVLLLISGAVSGGATRIQIDNDADDCLLRFDGQPLQAFDLGNLLPSLFALPSDRSWTRLRELSIGINTALGLGPRWIRMESWNGHQGLRCLFGPGGRQLEKLSSPPWDPPIAENRIHVRDRFQWRTVQRFLRGFRELPPEARAVTERCRWCPVPLKVNGVRVDEPVSFGGSWLAWCHRIGAHPQARLQAVRPGAIVEWEEHGDHGYSCVIALGSGEGGVLDLVVRGLSAPRRKVASRVPFRAVVSHPDLNRNVSQNDVVEDESYRRLEQELRALAVGSAFRLAPRYPGLSGAERDRARKLLLGALETEDPPEELLETPLFQLSEGREVPLQVLAGEVATRAHLRVTSRFWGVAPLDGGLVALLDEDSGPALSRLFPAQSCADELLEAALAAARNQERWRAAPAQPARLEEDPLLVRAALKELEGEVGLAPRRPRGWELTLLKHHRLLGVQREPSWLPSGVLVVVNDDGLQPAPSWDRVEDLSGIRKAAMAALPELYAAIPDEPEHRVPVRAHRREWELYLSLPSSGRVNLPAGQAGARFSRLLGELQDCSPAFQVVDGFLGGLGLGEPDRAADLQIFAGEEAVTGFFLAEQQLPAGLVGVLAGPNLEPPPGWDRLRPYPGLAALLDAVHQAVPALYARFLPHFEQPPPEHATALLDYLLAHPDCRAALRPLPMFVDAKGNALSLERLEAQVETHGWIGYLEHPSSTAGAKIVFPVLDRAAAGRLGRLLGPHRVRWDRAGPARETNRILLGKKPPHPIALQFPSPFRTPEDLEGDMGLDPGGQGLKVEVLYRNRLVSALQVPLDFGPLRAVVRDPWLATPDSRWSEIARDEACQHMLEALVLQAHRYSLELAQHLPEPSTVRYLRRYLAANLKGGRAPAEVLRRVQELPLFRLATGSEESWNELDRHQCSRGWLGYVTRPVAHEPEEDERVLRIDRDETELMRVLFRRGKLVDVAGFLEARGRGREAPFELPDRDYLEVFTVQQGWQALVGFPAAFNTRPAVRLFRGGRFLGVQRLDCAIPIQAVAESRRLNPNPDWRSVQEDAVLRELVSVLLRESEKRFLELLPGWMDQPEKRLYLLQIVRRALGAAPRAAGPMVAGLGALPLFRDPRGEPLSWRDLCDAPTYLAEDGTVDTRLLELLLPGQPVALVPRREVPLFRGIFRHAENAARLLQVSSAFYEGTPPAASIRLPAGNYAMRLPLPSPLQGEIGLYADVRCRSEADLYWHDRWLARVEIDHGVSFCAAVCDPRLRPQGSRGGVRREAAFRLLTNRLQQCAEAAVLALLEKTQLQFSPLVAGYLLRVLERLERSGGRSTELARRLENAPLIETVGGPPISLGTLEQIGTTARKLPYVRRDPVLETYSGEVLRQAAAVTSTGPLPVLDDELPLTQRMRLDGLSDATHLLEQDCRGVVNRRGSPLERFALEDWFPGREWLTRIHFDEPGARGEIGIPIGHAPSLPAVIAVEGIPVQRVTFEKAPDLCAVLDTRLKPARAWDRLECPDSAQNLLRDLFERLQIEFERGFPPPYDDRFLEARDKILRCCDWASYARWAGPQGLHRWLAEFRLFQLQGGRYASMLNLLDALSRRQRLVYCRPEEEAPALAEPVFRIPCGSPLESFLEGLSQGRLVPWSRRTCARPRPTEPQGGSEELLAAVKSEFSLLADECRPELARVLERMRLGETPAGTFVSFDGTALVLNADHPAVRWMLTERCYPPERLYLVLSGLHSVLNRALPELGDDQERGFHRRMLAALGA
ncbi:MAG: hypothetical protein HY319_32325 [Armatimonadetes bacterium]|nr:hypothetical protein [Armatimonadota bacterium]